MTSTRLWLPGMQTQEWFFRNHVQEITNVTIGSFLWAGLVVGEILYVRRIVVATKSGKRWCAATWTINFRALATCLCTHLPCSCCMTTGQGLGSSPCSL
jgi:hypothetical protein